MLDHTSDTMTKELVTRERVIIPNNKGAILNHVLGFSNNGEGNA